MEKIVYNYKRTNGNLRKTNAAIWYKKVQDQIH